MTPEQVKAQFHANGTTIHGWAQEHGFKTSYVYAVLNGRMKARFGTAHEIAVALGLKAKVQAA
ncbi:DNA-binding protein [Limnobaculum zhutongyuii]|uniref:DNA-binding protein n=2 Tax=Limnobaculum zhutongyuii TaxID=2498113 RepID=A0A411WRP4_9GAMM|nr:DNA-binding protein [Limnobaculum zhutongyuii]QBH98675.1 DNA-binding protein [Limnobaculum zhutongyuii]TQS86139.1 DNA-binding protein [Limnobaculum zhutongyuii]